MSLVRSGDVVVNRSTFPRIASTVLVAVALHAARRERLPLGDVGWSSPFLVVVVPDRQPR